MSGARATKDKICVKRGATEYATRSDDEICS